MEVATAALRAAHRANPFVCAWLAYHEHFVDVVDVEMESLLEADAQPGSVEEAFIFGAREIGVWLDTEGARDWVRQTLAEDDLGVPQCTPQDCSDVRFQQMYESALELAAEAQIEKDAQARGVGANAPSGDSGSRRSRTNSLDLC